MFLFQKLDSYCWEKGQHCPSFIWLPTLDNCRNEYPLLVQQSLFLWISLCDKTMISELTDYSIKSDIIHSPLKNCWVSSFNFWNRKKKKKKIHKHSFSFISLLNGILTFVGYLMPKPSLKKNRNDTIQPIDGGG